MKTKALNLTRAAMIAALYVILTLIANALGLANYSIQVRFSEALCVLPFFSAVAIPGLTVGCLLSNILTGCCLLDIVAGSFATLIGAVGAYLLRGNKWLVPIPTIIANALIVPYVLSSPYGYGIEGSYWFFVATVGAGEIISCGILGIILLVSLKKYADKLFTKQSF